MPTAVVVFAIPIVFFAFYVLFFLVRDRVVPPFGENFLITGLVSLGLQLASGGSQGREPILVALVAGACMAVGYLAVHQRQRAEVDRTIDSLFRSLPDPPRMALSHCAKALIEPDFIPDSITNKLSGMTRRDTRRNFANYINTAHGLIVTEESFFPTGYRKTASVGVTAALFTLSLGLFLYGYVPLLSDVGGR